MASCLLNNLGITLRGPATHRSLTNIEYRCIDLAAVLKEVQAGSKVINCSFGSDHPDANNAQDAAIYTRFLEKMAKRED